tara:strand:- start:1053 stop:1157 length:105 start_codon:yes stop_codon:yes gene_type:complete
METYWEIIKAIAIIAAPCAVIGLGLIWAIGNVED